MCSAYTRSALYCVVVLFILAEAAGARYAWSMKRFKLKTKPAAPEGKSSSTTSSKADKPQITNNGTYVLPICEVGGREGPDPTRYGDWEKNGRCVDF